MVAAIIQMQMGVWVPHKGGEVSERLKWLLIAILVLAWAIHLIIPLVVHSYKSSPEVHLAVMTVVGVIAAQKTKDGGDPPNADS